MQHFFMKGVAEIFVIDLSEVPFPLISHFDCVLPCVYQLKTSKIQAAFFLLFCLQRLFFHLL